MFNCGLKIHIVHILQSQLKLNNNTKGVPVDSNNTYPYSETEGSRYNDAHCSNPVVTDCYSAVRKQPRNALFFQNYQFVSRVCEQWKP